MAANSTALRLPPPRLKRRPRRRPAQQRAHASRRSPAVRDARPQSASITPRHRLPRPPSLGSAWSKRFVDLFVVFLLSPQG